MSEQEQPLFDFDGKTYEPDKDQARMNAQQRRVTSVMADGVWRTLAEIEKATGDPQPSISARLRDLRKMRMGFSTVERRRRGEDRRGLHEYRLVMTADTRKKMGL